MIRYSDVSAALRLSRYGIVGMRLGQGIGEYQTELDPREVAARPGCRLQLHGRDVVRQGGNRAVLVHRAVVRPHPGAAAARIAAATSPARVSTSRLIVGFEATAPNTSG